MKDPSTTHLLSTEQYAHFFEHALVGITIVDEKGGVLRANKAFCDFVGYTEAELQKLRFVDLTPPEDQPRTLEILGEWHREQRSCINLEQRYLRKDGVLVWGHVTANHWFSEKKEGDSILFSHVIVRDITHRKNRENELDLFRQLINQGNDAISVVDPKTARFIYVNNKLCEISQYSQGELLTMTVMDLETYLPDEEAWRQVAQTFQKQGFHVMEGLIQKKDGSRISVEVNVKYIQVGIAQYLLAIVRDMTERKKHEAQILQSQKLEAIGQLASGIAHEINTPMQFIESNTVFVKDGMAKLVPWMELLKQSLEVSGDASTLQALMVNAKAVLQPEPLEFFLKEIPKALQETLEGVARVTRIVRAMKEFSHPGQEGKTLTDLNKAIQNTLLVSQNEWKYVAEVDTHLDPNLPLVPCMPGEFNQVLLNLIVNASQAIGDVVLGGKKGKGQIAISTAQKTGCVEIRVQDTGGGIPKAIQGNIFNPFFTTKAVGKGTGQGLALARSIIMEKHGGTLFFETEEGKGSTFVIRLPLSPSPLEAPPPS